MLSSRSRGSLAGLCLGAAALLFSEGCSEVVHVAPPDFNSVPGRKGHVEITTRLGRVYNFRSVSVDNSNFVGEVDVIRNSISRDGHLDALETTEGVRLPFSDVVAVDLKRKDLPGTALALGAAGGLIAVFIRGFSPTPQPTGTPPPATGDNKAPRKR